MNSFVKNLQRLDFTQYEAQALDALIRYHQLSPTKLAKISKVPQPKIYETINRLEMKGYVDNLLEGKNRLVQIKPKQLLKEKLQQQFQIYERTITATREQIEDLFSTEETVPLPIMGIAGYKNIEENFIHLVETAVDHVKALINHDMLTQSVIKAIEKRQKSLQIDLIFNSEDDYLKCNLTPDQLSAVHKYYINPNDRAFFNKISHKMPQIIPKSVKDTYSFSLFLGVIEKLEHHLTLIVADNLRSLFLIPIPITTPLAVVSHLPEMVNFHVESMEHIMKSIIPL